MNSINLIGRLTNEPDLRYTQGGLSIMNVTMAIDRPLSREKKEAKKKNSEATADFPRIVMMGKSAELAQKYLQKGDLFSVTGRIRTSQYENSEGKVIYTTDILCERLQFLENKKTSEKTSQDLALSDVDAFEIEEIPY